MLPNRCLHLALFENAHEVNGKIAIINLGLSRFNDKGHCHRARPRVCASLWRCPQQLLHRPMTHWAPPRLIRIGPGNVIEAKCELPGAGKARSGESDSSRSKERFSLHGPKPHLPYVGTASSNHNTLKQLLKSVLPEIARYVLCEPGMGDRAGQLGSTYQPRSRIEPETRHQSLAVFGLREARKGLLLLPQQSCWINPQRPLRWNPSRH